MAAVKLSIQERRDLEKFTKFLGLKAAQIIVESRLGLKVHTKCKPYSTGTDWFNLAISDDHPDVLAEAKRILCGAEVVIARLPLCVEILLKTVEGNTITLETWCLKLVPDKCDPSIRITYTVYNRMGILLKSLVAITRITPAYKLSRHQGPDSYVILYRIYMGEPQLHNLGEGFMTSKVGDLITPVGTIYLNVFYRTKMTISPEHTGRDSSIMVKSDHFNPDLSPRHHRYQQSDEINTSLSETIKVGAFADCNHSHQPDPELIIPEVSFSRLLSPMKAPSPPNRTFNKERSNGVNKTDDDGNGNVTPKCQSPADSRRSSCSMSTNEDFIMVDLKTPFAGSNTNSDLGAFYRECQCAPPLQTFAELPSLADQMGDITKTIESLESNIHEYDDLLKSLSLNDNNN